MLTDMKIKQAKKEDKPYKLTDQNGLYLRVAKKSKRWYLRYTFEGKRQERPLGAYPGVTLVKARQLAADTQASLEEGIDPFAKPEEVAGASVTFGEAFETLFAIDTGKLAATTLYFRRQTYERHLKALANRPLDKITPQEIRDIVLPLHDAGHEALAKKVRGVVSKVYTDGVVRYGLTYDPSQASRRLVKVKRVRHHPHIEDKRLLGRLLADIERGNGGTSLSVVAALRMLPYLFVRKHELRHMHGRDIDLDDALWRVPVEVCKMRSPHLVPLPRQVVAMLRERMALIGSDGYLFPSPVRDEGIIGPNTLNLYLQRLGYDGAVITPHGFRGTASTALHEAGYASEWIETQLAHLERNDTAAAYNHAKYLPQRRKMMQEWADFLDGLRERYGREKDDPDGAVN